jgi:hypothetical protein
VSTGVPDHVRELLAQSLIAWRVTSDVRETDGALVLNAGKHELRIRRAAADLPFRWMTDDGKRTRGAASVSGLLRHVREAVDPAYRPIRLRIAPLPLVPP